MRIILGVTGGIAAYKAADLARLLIRDGHEVQAVLTRSAEEFVSAVTFASLTGQSGPTACPPSRSLSDLESTPHERYLASGERAKKS